MNIENYLNWSYLDTKPVIFFHDDHQEWLAFWNGIYMTAEYAYMIAVHLNLNFKLTPETKRVVLDKYSKFYHAGIFKYGKIVPYYESTQTYTIMDAIGDENIKAVTHGDNIIIWFKEFLKDARNN